MKNIILHSKLRSKITVLALSVLLTACGGGNSNNTTSDASSGESTTPPAGTTNPSSNALASTALSSFSLTSKAVSAAKSGIAKSKILSTRRYKSNTQEVPCNGGGKQTITDNIDPNSGELPTFMNFKVVFDQCKNTQADSESYLNGTLTMKIELNQSDPASMSSDYTFSISDAYFIDNSTGKSERVDIKGYKVTATGNQEKTTMEVSGSFKESSCLKQWVSIKTLSPIVMMTNNTCPTAGQMSMTLGQSTTTITYNADQSIDVGGNGSSQHYDNCNDLENLDDTNMCK